MLSILFILFASRACMAILVPPPPALLTAGLSYIFVIPRHGKSGSRSFCFPVWADPPLLRLAFVTALFAFKLRGEQLLLFALPRARQAVRFTVFSTLLSRFGGLGPHAGLDGRRKDFCGACSPFIRLQRAAPTQCKAWA